MMKFILVYHAGMNSKLPGFMMELGIATNCNWCTMVYPKTKHLFCFRNGKKSVEFPLFPAICMDAQLFEFEALYHIGLEN
jgi:hypothetical protein